MNSIRIKNDNLYVIEVNDNGDTIELDPTDIELPFKLEKAYKTANDVTSKLKTDLLLIEKQKDENIKGEMMTKNQKATMTAYRKAFKTMRDAYDAFLGTGACQKIFGDRNYLEMFNDLNEQLEPHFENMNIGKDGVVERIKAKYGNDEEDVLK